MTTHHHFEVRGVQPLPISTDDQYHLLSGPSKEPKVTVVGPVHQPHGTLYRRTTTFNFKASPETTIPTSPRCKGGWWGDHKPTSSRQYQTFKRQNDPTKKGQKGRSLSCEKNRDKNRRGQPQRPNTRRSQDSDPTYSVFLLGTLSD